MDIYLNGQLVPPAQARVGLDDAGLQHAVGLFETMASYRGNVFRLQAHLDRLARSARELGLASDLDTAALAEAVRKTIRHNQIDRARIRLTLTPGSVSLLRPQEGTTPQPTLAVVATPPIQYDRAYFERGVTVVIAGPAANPFDPIAGHKTLAYWSRLRTLRDAAAAPGGGAAEAIWLNITNHLASGAISNLFLVKDGTLLTPFARGEELPEALPAPVLPGITRAAVLEVAESQHVPVVKRMLTVEDLLDADEVFLTNSSWLILPVAKVEKKAIGAGKAGDLTRALRQGLAALIATETGVNPET